MSCNSSSLDALVSPLATQQSMSNLGCACSCRQESHTAFTTLEERLEVLVVFGPAEGLKTQSLPSLQLDDVFLRG